MFVRNCVIVVLIMEYFFYRSLMFNCASVDHNCTNMWRLYKRMVCTWTICWCEVMFRVGAWSLLWCFVTPSAGLPPVSVPVLCVSCGLQQRYHRVYNWMWTFWNLCDAGVHSSRCATKSTEMGKTLRKKSFLSTYDLWLHYYNIVNIMSRPLRWTKRLLNCS